MVTFRLSAMQSERENQRQLADLAVTVFDREGFSVPPHVLAAAARILRDRVRADEAGRQRGRKVASQKTARRTAQWEAEIAAAVQRGKGLGLLVKRHEAARANAVEVARRAQLAGIQGPSADERQAESKAGLSRSTIYAIAKRLKK